MLLLCRKDLAVPPIPLFSSLLWPPEHALCCFLAFGCLFAWIVPVFLVSSVAVVQTTAGQNGAKETESHESGKKKPFCCRQSSKMS